MYKVIVFDVQVGNITYRGVNALCARAYQSRYGIANVVVTPRVRSW
jgi:hypothetical protein